MLTLIERSRRLWLCAESDDKLHVRNIPMHELEVGHIYLSTKSVNSIVRIIHSTFNIDVYYKVLASAYDYEPQPSLLPGVDYASYSKIATFTVVTSPLFSSAVFPLEMYR